MRCGQVVWVLKGCSFTGGHGPMSRMFSGGKFDKVRLGWALAGAHVLQGLVALLTCLQQLQGHVSSLYPPFTPPYKWAWQSMPCVTALRIADGHIETLSICRPPPPPLSFNRRTWDSWTSALKMMLTNVKVAPPCGHRLILSAPSCRCREDG